MRVFNDKFKVGESGRKGLSLIYSLPDIMTIPNFLPSIYPQTSIFFINRHNVRCITYVVTTLPYCTICYITL